MIPLSSLHSAPAFATGFPATVLLSKEIRGTVVSGWDAGTITRLVKETQVDYRLYKGWLTRKLRRFAIEGGKFFDKKFG